MKACFLGFIAVAIAYTPMPIMANMPTSPSIEKASLVQNSVNAAPIISGITQDEHSAVPMACLCRYASRSCTYCMASASLSSGQRALTGASSGASASSKPCARIRDAMSSYSSSTRLWLAASLMPFARSAS